ncbi:MAG TPA: pitrilysin family protein [Pyrinomonadaceae bacterium]|nr:pitrilysin family protein [Pyrinomonadaceae bacterium]
MSQVKSEKLKVKNLIVLSFAFLVCFAGNLFAQKETPPIGGQPKPFVFPKEEVYTLPNGLKVTLVQYGSVPKVAFQATIYAGTKDDAKGKKAVSEMVGSMLKEGTKTRTAEQIARETAEMGGSINVGTGTDSTNITGEVLSEFDSKFIVLMADVILNPSFQADSLEQLRANKLRSLAVARTQAGNQAWEKFRSVVFQNHPYSQINPTDDEVKGYTLDDIKNFYDANYSAARTNLYVVGKFNAAEVKAAIAKAFGSMKKGTSGTRNIPNVQAKKSLSTIDRPDAPQSTIYLGMPAPNPADPDYPKFVVMDSILGGSFGSRITANIRENKGYTYSPSSFIWTRYKTGYWVENADVTTQFTGASIKEILFEINRMRTETVGADELQGIKNYLVGLYVLNNSTRFGVINQLENMNYNELPKSSIDNYVKEISAVTAQDVQNMAKKYLTEDKLSIVVVGDLKKINEQLNPYEK